MRHVRPSLTQVVLFEDRPVRSFHVEKGVEKLVQPSTRLTATAARFNHIFYQPWRSQSDKEKEEEEVEESGGESDVEGFSRFSYTLLRFHAFHVAQRLKL